MTATRRDIRGRWFAAALALAMTSADGQARGVPAEPAGTLQRATALVRAGAFEEGAAMLRRLLSADPANRGARELLAFALESLGDLEGERRVRSGLAAEFPDDPRILADHGRVLERSGEERLALGAYRRARELGAVEPAPGLDAAIERMRGRTALEVGTPLTVMSDPDARSSCGRVGAAVPLGRRSHLAILGSRYAARARTGPVATAAGMASVSAVLRGGGGAYASLGTLVHVVSPRGGGRRDVAFGAVLAGRAPLGHSLEAEGRAELGAPWDEAAVTVLHGGRASSADGRLYSHWFSRRLILQAGARSRRLTVLPGSSTRRPEARQDLRLAGADVVLWRQPGAAVRGEMLDETLTTPTTTSPALTLAYRHYAIANRPTPGFATLIGLVPRASVDELSLATTVASLQGRLGLELRTGLAHDSRRTARSWRAGGAVSWAPGPMTRIVVGFEEATEAAAGLTGRRRAGWLRFHADL